MANRASQRAHQRRMAQIDWRTQKLTGVCTLALLVIAIAFIACAKTAPPTEEEREQIEAAQRASDRQWADELIQDFRHVYDERTGICYVYVWRMSGYRESAAGGPALTQVACTDKVRALLLNPPPPKPKTPLAPVESETPPAEAPAAP